MKIIKLYFLIITFYLLNFYCYPAENELFFWKINTNDKVIFLTFDDGPGEYTEKVLNILKMYNIKATFFVLGELVKLRSDLVRELVSNGHSIGIHTFSHPNFYKLQKRYTVKQLEEILISELKNTEHELKQVLGKDFNIKLVRMPHGYYRKWMDETLKKFGYKIVNWTFGCDWFNYTEEKMLNMYITALQPGGIYLFHDGGKDRKKTVKVLEKFIQHCLQQGYRFELLDSVIK